MMVRYGGGAGGAKEGASLDFPSFAVWHAFIHTYNARRTLPSLLPFFEWKVNDEGK